MINLMQACVDFYAMQVIDIEHNVEGIKYKRFVKYRKTHTKQLANAMSDYLVLACAGELRHGRDKCAKYYPSFPTGGSRDTIWGDIQKYEPTVIMEMATELFTDWDWDSGYGGKKWGQCAKAYVSRNTKGHIMQKDIIFVDHCFDLQHNNGTVFNKGCNIFTETGIGYLLDTKRDSVEQIFASFSVSPIVVYFMSELEVLYKGSFISNNKKIDEVMNYIPIQWGNMPIDKKMEDGHYAEESEREEEYEEEYEERSHCRREQREHNRGADYKSGDFNYTPIGIRLSPNTISDNSASVVREGTNNNGQPEYNRNEYLASLSKRIIR